jgi:alkylated DNA repair dioxygenase AlkB
VDAIELNLPHANLYLIRHYVKDTERMFEYLKSHLSWLRDEDLPHSPSMCNMGTDYLASSGRFRIGQKIDPLVLKLMNQLNDEFNVMMNSCFAILYETGNAELPYRSHATPSLDYDQPILSIAYGASSTVTFKDTYSDEEFDFVLSDGDLLIMPDLCQKNYFNAVKRSDQYTSPRLSLSFRRFNDGVFY